MTSHSFHAAQRDQANATIKGGWGAWEVWNKPTLFIASLPKIKHCFEIDSNHQANFRNTLEIS